MAAVQPTVGTSEYDEPINEYFPRSSEQDFQTQNYIFSDPSQQQQQQQQHNHHQQQQSKSKTTTNKAKPRKSKRSGKNQ